jgi:NADPH:quinone reductase-like Zn-dependent oxidoreductase
MMRSVAVCGVGVKDLLPQNDSIETIEIHGRPVTVGLIPTPEPRFDASDASCRSAALVRVLGFSCNYRDQTLVFAPFKAGGERGFRVVGSEFVGEVLEVGAGVEKLRPGDRVIGDNCYPPAAGGCAWGIPTNESAGEYQVLDGSKLMKVPREMSLAEAAGFSVGAQTAYAMIRRLAVSARSKVLVTAATSNTSLFVINALRKHRAAVYAASTSPLFADRLKQLGVREVVTAERAGGDGERAATEHAALAELAASVGGFDCVIDPFFDIYFATAVELLALGGKYVTCGLAGQYQGLAGEPFRSREPDFRRTFVRMISHNLEVVGNCLGLTEDLAAAVRDYAEGSFRVTVDSVHTGARVGDFFRRTFDARDRFGKVVYLYDESSPA